MWLDHTTAMPNHYTSIDCGGTTLAPSGYCPWCSQPNLGSYVFHSGRCPNVKVIEYYPNGTIKRIEFVQDNPEPVTLTYICDEWKQVVNDYPPDFYRRVVDEVMEKLLSQDRLKGLNH